MIMNSEEIINIKIRLKQLENYVKNNELDFLNYSKKYKDTLKIKYANKAFDAEKNIKRYKSLIEKYNYLLKKQDAV